MFFIKKKQKKQTMMKFRLIVILCNIIRKSDAKLENCCVFMPYCLVHLQTLVTYDVFQGVEGVNLFLLITTFPSSCQDPQNFNNRMVAMETHNSISSINVLVMCSER